MKCRIRLNDFTHFSSLTHSNCRMDFAKTTLGDNGFSKIIKNRVRYLIMLTTNTELKVFCEFNNIQWLSKRRSRNE